MSELVSFKFPHYQQCEKCEKPIVNDFFFCVCKCKRKKKQEKIEYATTTWISTAKKK